VPPQALESVSVTSLSDSPSETALLLSISTCSKVYIQGESDARAVPSDLGKWFVRGSDNSMTPFSAQRRRSRCSAPGFPGRIASGWWRRRRTASCCYRSSAWGGTYVNDFIDRGRVKKVYIQGESDARAVPL
jgi:hypothetical protein